MNYLLTIGIIAILLFAVKLYVKYTTGVYRGIARLDGKTVIVTGAHNGIGFVSAKDFAYRGARVIMVCPDLTKGERLRQRIVRETENYSVKVYEIDFTSLDSVRCGAYDILESERRIDVLLNNTGLTVGNASRKTADNLNLMMQANYFGPFLFTNILLGRIKKSAPSRIVNVSSVVHYWANLKLNKFKNPAPCDVKTVFANAKLASILFTNELARKLEDTEVTVNSLHPGAVATKTFNAKRAIYYQKFRNFLFSLIFKSPQEGAQTSIYLCVSPDVWNKSGEYFSDCKMSVSSATSKNLDLARKVWHLSEDAVKLRAYEKHY